MLNTKGFSGLPPAVRGSQETSGDISPRGAWTRDGDADNVAAMARLPYVNIDELPEELRARLEGLPPLNIYRLLAHTPSFVHLLGLTSAGMYAAEIDQRLRELSILRVAHLTGARYIWVQHVGIARSLGLSEAQVEAIPQGAGAEVFGELEGLVLRFTDEMTQGVKVSEATFQAISRHLSPRCLMELAIAVGLYGMIARVMETFEIDLEPGAGTYTRESLRAGGMELLKGSG